MANEINPTRPTLSWSDVDLLKFLADIWDQKSYKNIQVVGRLNQVDGELHAFLTDLHHPASGIKLPLSGNSTENRVFVPSSELQRFYQSQAPTTFALATLDLSPLTRREDRRDPLACKVRRGTLTPLVSIPAEWGVHGLTSEPASLITDMARQVIEARLREETAGAEVQLKASRVKLAAAQAENEKLNQQLKGLQVEIDNTASRARDALNNSIGDNSARFDG